MGISLVDKNADYSAIAIGFSDLYTTITAGLLALHDTSGTAEKVLTNSVKEVSAATIIGNPIITESNTKTTLNNTIDFGVKPTGERSYACVINLRPNPQPDLSLIASRNAADTLKGGDAVLTFNGSSYSSASTYSNKVGPLTGMQNILINDTAAGTREHELIVVTLKDEVGMTMYIPRTSTKLFVAVAAGRYFAVDNPDTYQAMRGNAKGEARVGMFALWNRPLTDLEVATFYTDVKPQLARNNALI